MTAYILKMFPRFSETFILSEILELEHRGHSVHVISLRKPDDGKFHEDLARVRAAVRYLPEHLRCAPWRFIAAHVRAARRSPRAYARTVGLCLRLIPGSVGGFLRAPLIAEAARAAGCRSMHAHFATLPAIAAMFASLLAGLPFSFTAHAKDIFLDGRSRRMLRTLLHRARRVITVSDYNVRHLSEVGGPSLPAGRIVRVYNGVEVESIRPGPGDAIGSGKLILAVGRLVEKKGFADLIDVLAVLRERGVDFRCEIIGKGPLHADLARRIAERGLEDRAFLVGPLPRGEVARRLARAAVLAAPCVVGRDGNRDGLPTVILEAMAAGVPVVATRVTGIPEAVEDGVTGVLTEPGDVEGLARGLAAILHDPALRARLGRSARRAAEARFDLRRNVAELDAVLGLEGAAAPARGELLASQAAS